MNRTMMVFTVIALMLFSSSCSLSKGGGSVQTALQGKQNNQSTSGQVPVNNPDDAGPVSEQGPSNDLASEPVGTNGLKTAIYPAALGYLGEQKWGYIDKSGKFTLKPKYTKAFRFQPNGLAVVLVQDKYGLIDRMGKYVVEPIYSYINDYSEGLASAREENGTVVLNSEGDVLSQPYPYIGDYKSNRAVYAIQAQNHTYLYGYLDETGKTAIQPAYESAGSFEGDRAVVKLPGKEYALIDKNGKIIKTLPYQYVMGISDGMMAFKMDADGKFGYLNSNGSIAVQPSFLEAQDFSGGTAVVNAAKDYVVHQIGLIDKKGKYLIKPQYSEILQLGEGMVALGIAADANNPFAGSKFALATQEGTILTDFMFYNIKPFKDGAASVYDKVNVYFIDKTGNRIADLPSAEGMGSLELLDGLVYADIDSRHYYMNNQRSVIYRPDQSIVLKNGIKVTESKFSPNRNYLDYYPILENLASLKVEDNINTRLRAMWKENVNVKPEDNLDYHYEGGFDIGFYMKNLLVLQRTGYDYPFGAAHGMPVMDYIHVDTKTGSFYQLEDLFKDGSNYTGVLSEIVKKQIEKQVQEQGEEAFIWPDSYKGIRSDHTFYLTEDALMLYFTPYEIAPYAAGYPTFSVPYVDISDIINKKGSFWLSFN